MRSSTPAVLFVLVGVLVARPWPAYGRAPAVITLESLLRELTDVQAIARWPDPEFSCRQASSYDRARVAPGRPGWFANHDHSQFIRTETRGGRTEQVMLDVEGPGALVRFWLTAGQPTAGRLRVYLDGGDAPVLAFPAFDLLGGSLKLPEALLQPHPGYEPGRGGNTLYLPIPYARHCKVTWQEGPQPAARYYQINYRTYPPGTPVKTFAPEQLAAAKGLIERTARVLAAPPRSTPGRLVSLQATLTGGANASLTLPAGPGAVRALELRLSTGEPAQAERAFRSTIVQVTFDGARTVWCPATDLFGSGVGINELRSWYRSVSADGSMRCRWVMPYRRSAQVTLANVGTTPVTATLRAVTAPWEWDARSMHFHAAWHFEAGMRTPPLRDWNYVEITGRGVYAGDSLALFNPVPTWYGEGNEKIWVDGEAFPSHLGTGTEDYYGYSYAPRGLIQTPFVNQVRVDDPRTQGHNVLSRTRHLDGIPFKKSLRFDMELISWEPTRLTYAATTYWYAFPGASANVAPQPAEAALPVPTLAALKPRKPGTH